MKKFLLAAILLYLFSCGKNRDLSVKPINFNLLTKYGWQQITAGKMRSPIDTSQVLPYADTSLYLFDGKEFIYKDQRTTFSIILGQPASFKLNKSYWTITGQYVLNLLDSTISMSWKMKITDPWLPEDGDDTITTKAESWKIYSISKKELQIDHSPFPREVFRAVVK